MSSAGHLDCRFFWERIDDEHRIYDRQRGAGCFGENFIATAVDGVAAEMLCGLSNQGAAPKSSPFDFGGYNDFTDEDVAADEAFEAQIAREGAAGFDRWAK